MVNLINKETGAKIADMPEELPPLRDGYIRLIHQTSFTQGESLAEHGLIYNREYAQKHGFSKYTEITSMAVAYDEDSFWDRLTQEGIRHKGANAIAVFDMPAEECKAHQIGQIAQYLNGTISRGYMVGMIPNYGTKDYQICEKLSVVEMEEKKQISKSNPLPPLYETPEWRKNIAAAYETLQQENADNDRFIPHGGESNTGTDNDDSGNNDDADWADFDAWLEEDAEAPSQKSEQINWGKTDNEDYLAYKMQFIKEKLQEKNLESTMGVTGDSRTGNISGQHQQTAEIQTNAARMAHLSFKQITEDER